MWVDSDHITAQIRQVAPIQLPAEEYSGAKSDRQQDGQRVALQVKVGTHAEPGAYRLRLISDRGISNPVTFLVGAEPVVVEDEGEHQLSKNAQSVTAPVSVQGRISEEGETDWYEFEAGESEDLMLEVVCNPSIDAVLASKDCDPRITLYEPTGSWFSPATLTRLAAEAASRADRLWERAMREALK